MGVPVEIYKARSFIPEGLWGRKRGQATTTPSVQKPPQMLG